MFSLMTCVIDWRGALIKPGDSMKREGFAYVFTGEDYYSEGDMKNDLKQVKCSSIITKFNV